MTELHGDADISILVKIGTGQVLRFGEHIVAIGEMVGVVFPFLHDRTQSAAEHILIISAHTDACELGIPVKVETSNLVAGAEGEFFFIDAFIGAGHKGGDFAVSSVYKTVTQAIR